MYYNYSISIFTGIRVYLREIVVMAQDHHNKVKISMK